MRVCARAPGGGRAAELRIEGITAGSEDAAGEAVKVPTPGELLAAALASCTATTMELYARRKGWEVGEVEVDVDYTPSRRGSPTRCAIVVRLPEHLASERRERLMQVGAISQLHRTLEGEVAFEERVELTTAPRPAAPEHVAAARRRPVALLNGLWGALRSSTAP